MHKKVACTRTFIETFEKIVKSWKKPGCPSSKEYLDCGTSVHTMYYHLAKWHNCTTGLLYNRILGQKSKIKEIYKVAYIC